MPVGISFDFMKTEQQIDEQARRIIARLRETRSHFVGCRGKIDEQAIWQMARRVKCQNGIPLFKPQV